MKTTTATLISSVLLLAACVPPAQLPSSNNVAPATEYDRFESGSYAVATNNTEDLQGLWIMTTKNYLDSTTTENTRTHQTSATETSGSFRMACTIILIGTEYITPCFGAGNLLLTEGSLTNSEGTLLATSTNNTHLAGTYYTENVSNNLFKGIVTTTTTVMDFEMVKINVPGAVIGNMTLTSNDVTESSDIVEFYETEFTEVVYDNGLAVSSNSMTIFNAFGNSGKLFGRYSQVDGVSILANTSSLNIESNSASISTSANTATSISMSITGEDTNNAVFSGSIDITL